MGAIVIPPRESVEARLTLATEAPFAQVEFY